MSHRCEECGRPCDCGLDEFCSSCSQCRDLYEIDWGDDDDDEDGGDDEESWGV